MFSSFGPELADKGSRGQFEAPSCADRGGQRVDN